MNNLNIIISICIATFCSLLIGIHFHGTAIKLSRMIRLDQIEFEVGDLLLFHASPLLSMLLGSSWTHVGIVAKNNDGILCIWESTPAYQFPVLTPLECLRERLKTETIAWRCNSQPMDVKTVGLHHQQYNFGSWQRILRQLLPSPWFLPVPVDSTNHLASCVELTKQTLSASGVDVPSTVLVPADFSSDAEWTTRWEIERKIIL